MRFKIAVGLIGVLCFAVYEQSHGQGQDRQKIALELLQTALKCPSEIADDGRSGWKSVLTYAFEGDATNIRFRSTQWKTWVEEKRKERTEEATFLAKRRDLKSVAEVSVMAPGTKWQQHFAFIPCKQERNCVEYKGSGHNRKLPTIQIMACSKENAEDIKAALDVILAGQ